MRMIVLLMLLLSAGCSSYEITGSAVQQIPEEDGFIDLFFCPRDNCSARFIEMFADASEIGCAFFDIDIPEMIEFLDEKDARLVVDNVNEFSYSNVVFDNGNQLSHNKFCIVDDSVVWTGSFNPTHNGDNRNNNNVVVINSGYLAVNYNDEFEELWSGEFGDGEGVKYSKVIVDGILVENYFCPEDGCKERVIEVLSGAERSIYFMVFSFTDRDIADVLIEKSSVIDVAGVVEKQRITMKYNVYEYLSDGWVDVVGDKSKGILHHKVFIVDSEIVITGSYNPTKAGDSKNDENLLIIHDKGVAEKFMEEFELVRGD